MRVFLKSLSKYHRQLLCTFSVILLTLSVRGQNSEILVDLSNYSGSNGIQISIENKLLHVTWETDNTTNYTSFRLEKNSGGKERHPQLPLIKSIGTTNNGIATEIFNDLQPEYALFLGERDLDKRKDSWQIFFDYPYQRSYSVQKALLDMESATISSHGNRTTISFNGLKAGEFEGALNFTIYAGSSLLHMEAVISTEQNGRAFLYHAGLSNLSGQIKNVCWQNGEDEFIRQPSNKEFATPKKTRFRTIIAESDNGSLAVFSSPHRFLPPLDGVGNYGFNWSGQNYLDFFNGYGIGVRQPIFGDRRQVPWLNAEPGSIQKLGLFLYISDRKAENTLTQIKKFTHNDRFVDIPGYKKFTSHYHVEHSLDYLKKQKEQQTTGIPKGLENPDFVQFFKKMGIDIVHLGEFHNGATPRLNTEKRMQQLQIMHQECERLSTNDFLLLPGEEPNVQLGGHWMSFFPKPVNWVLNRSDDKPFVENNKKYGKVYHVGSKEDILKLFKKENGLIWVAHGRIKGSTGYPDNYKNEAFFTSDRYLGAAWKNMPANLSEDTMGSRILNLLDDMSNWNAKKYALGEVDVFDIRNDYELYGAMNVNYLKLDELPKFKDGWKPVLDVLSEGNFIVSTGEILLKKYSVGGQECGTTLKLKKDKKVELKAALDWTFPLTHIDIVTGDGENIYHQKIKLNDTKAFGSKEFKINIDLKDRTWVRFEVWDIATNGTYTQPIWIEN
jgi:hypothetical protein